LGWLRRERARWAQFKGISKKLARRIDRLDARIAELESKVETLDGLIRNKSIGTTPKRKDG
jgi:hypothetical protein